MSNAWPRRCRNRVKYRAALQLASTIFAVERSWTRVTLRRSWWLVTASWGRKAERMIFNSFLRPLKTFGTESVLDQGCDRAIMNMRSRLQYISDKKNISDTTSASCSFVHNLQRHRESSAQWKKGAGRSKSWKRSSHTDIIKLRR
jgi:hypothetical protein